MRTIIALTLCRTPAIGLNTVFPDEHRICLIEKYETFIRIRIPHTRFPYDLRQSYLATVGERKTNSVRRKGGFEVRAAFT